MTTRNKSALGAVRIVSMAGISAAALLIGMAAAHAQTVDVAGGGTGAVTVVGTTLTPAVGTITGLAFNDGTSNTVTIDAITGLTMTVPATFGSTGQATIDALGNIGTTATITGGSLSDGTATLTGGNLTGVGTLSANGLITGTGGLAITGGTMTDTLTATGLSTFGGAGNTTIGANGDLTVGSVGTNANLNVNGNIATTGTLGVTSTSTFGDTATFNGTGANAGTTTAINGASITSTVAAGVNQGSTTINGANTAIQGPNGGTFGTTISDVSALNNVYVGLASLPGLPAGTTVGLVQIYNGTTGSLNNSTADGMRVTNGTNTVSVGVNPTTGAAGSSVQTSTGYVGIGSSGTGNPTGVLVTNGTGTTGTREFVANSTGYISTGGNAIHDVATPILGTDAANKAYVDKGVNKAYEGTAIALAISQPVFLPGQSFAIRAGWGNYESQNAFGVSAAGVIARDVFGYGSTVALDGGVGVGGNYNGVAGKAGLTIGFGGGMAPMAPMK